MSRCKGQTSSVRGRKLACRATSVLSLPFSCCAFDAIPRHFTSCERYYEYPLPLSQAVHLSLQFSNNTFKTHVEIMETHDLYNRLHNPATFFRSISISYFPVPFPTDVPFLCRWRSGHRPAADCGARGGRGRSARPTRFGHVSTKRCHSHCFCTIKLLRTVGRRAEKLQSFSLSVFLLARSKVLTMRLRPIVRMRIQRGLCRGTVRSVASVNKG
jgi:hypothetical protein